MCKSAKFVYVKLA